MNPQDKQQYPEFNELPAPVEPARPQNAERAFFPPLGATLPTYHQQGSLGPLNPQSSANRTSSLADAQTPRRSPKKIFKRIFITLLIIGILAGGYIGVKFLITASKTLGGSLFGLVQNDKLKGEDDGHVEILLAGNSADDAGHSGGDLTDSIMLISLNTKNNTAFVMSIPRDLYVDIQGNGHSKINAAYVYGKQAGFSESGYPSGGMGLLQKTVEQNFDVKIDYYALVNYSALRDAVNAVGGIDVTIASSDPRGLYDPSRDYTKSYRAPLVKLSNGVNHLDGQSALNLARARGDSYGSYGYAQSDFTRTSNQRLMLTAIKDKATTAGILANPIKLGSLLDSIGDNVQTDFQTNEVRRLVTLSQKIPNSSITSVSLNDVNGKNLLMSYRGAGGQSALAPAAGLDNYTAINAYLQQLLNPPTTTTPGDTPSSNN